MKPLFRLLPDDAKLLPAMRRAYPFDRAHLALVTPTLLPASVALVTFDDVLRILEVRSDSVRLSEVAKEYLYTVAGGQMTGIIPLLLPHEIAYLQSRRLVLYDLSRRAHEVYRVTDDIEELAVAAAWVSMTPRRIVVQVEDTSNYDLDHRVDMRLRAYDISGGRATLCGIFELAPNTPKDENWNAGRGVIVVVLDGKLQVLDSTLAALPDHPLTKPMNELVSQGKKIRGLRLHPTQDLIAAALEDGSGGSRRYGVFKAIWDANGDVTISMLTEIYEASALRLGAFSPDGDWLSYSVEHQGRVGAFVQKFSDPSSAPVALDSTTSLHAACWTRDPTMFVLFDRDLCSIAWWTPDLLPRTG